MGTLQRQGGAVGGARAFQTIRDQLNAHLVPLTEQTTSQRADRDSRAADLRDALRLGPATAAELAARSGIDSKRIGGILSNDVAAGRILTQRDARTPNRTLVYTLASQRSAGARS
jgi:hypothetical protein